MLLHFPPVKGTCGGTGISTFKSTARFWDLRHLGQEFRNICNFYHALHSQSTA